VRQFHTTEPLAYIWRVDLDVLPPCHSLTTLEGLEQLDTQEVDCQVRRISPVATYPLEHFEFVEGLEGCQYLLSLQAMPTVRKIVYYMGNYHCEREEVKNMKNADLQLLQALQNSMKAIQTLHYGENPNLSRKSKLHASYVVKNLHENPLFNGVGQYYHQEEFLAMIDRLEKPRAKAPIFHGLFSRSGPLILDTCSLTDLDEIRECYANKTLHKFQKRIIIPSGFMVGFLPWFFHSGLVTLSYTGVTHLRTSYEIEPVYDEFDFGQFLTEIDWVRVELHTSRV